MTYAEIDLTVNAWVARHALTLFTQVEGAEVPEVRGVYLSSNSGECCQIWIDTPQLATVEVHAADVETMSESWRREWSSTTEALAGTLEETLEFAKRWLQRDGAELFLSSRCSS